jgi:hypothetical protein
MKKHHPQSTNVSSMTANIEQRCFNKETNYERSWRKPQKPKTTNLEKIKVPNLSQSYIDKSKD